MNFLYRQLGYQYLRGWQYKESVKMIMELCKKSR